MKVLVVGGGGREHAIVWKLSQSRRISKLFCAPGNAGISDLADCVDIQATDLDGITKFSKENRMDLVVVAPDDPLALGLVDRLQEQGIRSFGPNAAAAVIEASKSFSKELMQKYHIPTAEYSSFTDSQKAVEYLKELTPPIVVKADGLAMGKGVVIAQSQKEAQDAILDMMEGNCFGSAGKTIVIEEFLKGKELTVLAFTDGKTIYPMINSKDHKKAMDQDQGLNTGGMGAICPGEPLTDLMKQQLYDEIFYPTMCAMCAEGRKFKGVLYFGLMLTDSGPKVIEYNARFGDPEAQAILPLLETDLLEIIDAIIDERLDQITIQWKNMASCCVVVVSGGYPKAYQTGYEIRGLDSLDTLVFHAGTKKNLSDSGIQILTAGGRVLGITAIADSLDEAIRKAYEDVRKVSFEKMYYRTDIGKRQ